MDDQQLHESEVSTLDGYRGMGPVRIGNQAYQQIQHDVYGSAILAATHIFFDQRLTRRGDAALFHTWSRWVNKRADATTSRMRVFGNSVAAHVCTRFLRSCAGSPATAWHASPNNWS
jgi:hypothetical protein